jgi:trigger factor
MASASSRRCSSTWIDRRSEGDVVLLDSTRLDANGRRMPGTRSKGQRVLLGAPGLMPDLENGLLGATAGQERTIEVQYPADHERSELAGKKVRYIVAIPENPGKEAEADGR